MSTHEKSTSVMTRWAIPGVAAFIGLAYLVTGVVGDDLGFGVFGLILMLGVGLAFVIAARCSETGRPRWSPG